MFHFDVSVVGAHAHAHLMTRVSSLPAQSRDPERLSCLLRWKAASAPESSRKVSVYMREARSSSEAGDAASTVSSARLLNPKPSL